MAKRWLDGCLHGASQMMARAAALLAAIACMIAFASLLSRRAYADSLTLCPIGARGGDFNAQTGVLIHGKCLSYGGTGSDISGTPVQTRVVGCALGDHWQIDRCGPAQIDCNPLPGQSKRPEAFITQVKVGTVWIPAGDPWCAGQDNPVPTPAMLRDQALKLLPRVGIGAAPAGGRTLVNMQTILWAQTPADRDLGTVTVVGHQVGLRVHLTRADWDFGDGGTATATTPGRPYTASDDCSTKQCPGFFGHTYTATGSVTVRLTITWTAQFRLAGTTSWAAVPGPLTGPPATSALRVLEARGVLVAN